MPLLTLPYVVLAWLATRGTTYTGVIFNPNDTFLYYAQIAHAQHRAWMFREYFTYLPSQSLLAYTLYSALGHAAPVAKGTSWRWAFNRLVLAALFICQAWMYFGPGEQRHARIDPEARGFMTRAYSADGPSIYEATFAKAGLGFFGQSALQPGGLRTTR